MAEEEWALRFRIWKTVGMAGCALAVGLVTVLVATHEPRLATAWPFLLWLGVAVLAALGIWRIPISWFRRPALAHIPSVAYTLLVLGAVAVSPADCREEVLFLFFFVPLLAMTAFLRDVLPMVVWGGVTTALFVGASAWVGQVWYHILVRLLFLWSVMAVASLAAERAASRNRTLLHLQQVALAAAASLSMRELLDNVLAALGQVAEGASAHILLRNEKDELILAAVRGVEESPDVEAIPIGRGVTGTAAARREALYIPDVRQFPDYLEGTPTTVSEFALPLLVGDRLVGVLNLESTEKDAFGRWERGFLSAVAPQVALNLRNAQLFAQLQERTKQQEELAESVAGVAENLLVLAEQLAASSEEVGAGAEEIAATVAQFARGAQTQARRVEQVSNVVQSTARDAQELADLARSAEETLGRAGKALEAAKADLAKLDEKLQEVQDMVTLVDGFADRTDLLALNAAIEAARAGQHGKGFAVLAEEIRRLAESSARSVARISLLGEEMDTCSRAARGSMQETDRAMDQVRGLSKVVLEGSAKHSGQVEEALGAVEEIASIAEQSAVATRQVATAMDQQSSAMNEVAQTAQQVASMAAALQKVVAELRQGSLLREVQSHA
ncbi:MAG: methyl-accepting chemotaxis protein [Anaerolineae bacterium]